jgi:Helix-turn-helix domain
VTFISPPEQSLRSLDGRLCTRALPNEGTNWAATRDGRQNPLESPFHNAKSGLCFPSYEAIAEAAHCARSTVAEAIRALEDAGVLTWVQRIKRVRERCADLLGDNGWQTRVLRTSNAYSFHDPGASDRPSKSDFPTETPNQAFPFLYPSSPNASSSTVRGRH